jgi:hypothetical protein
LLDGGNAVKATVTLLALMFVVSLIASVAAAADASKVNTSIYGFYLGESKASLLQRAQKEGIPFTPKGKIASQIFPESYMFDAAMNKSQDVKYVVVSFHRNLVGQLDVYLADNSEQKYMQASQGLDQSWNSVAGFSAQDFGPMHIVTLPDVLITLVTGKGETHISYVHRGIMRMYGEDRDKGSRE